MEQAEVNRNKMLRAIILSWAQEFDVGFGDDESELNNLVESLGTALLQVCALITTPSRQKFSLMAAVVEEWAEREHCVFDSSEVDALVNQIIDQMEF